MQSLTLFLTPPLERVWLQTVLYSRQQNFEPAAVQSENISIYCSSYGGHFVFTHKKMCKRLQTYFGAISALRVNPVKTQDLVIIEESIIYAA